MKRLFVPPMIAILALPVTEVALAGRDFDPAAFEPDEAAASGASLSTRTWSAAGAGWTIELQHIDDAERLRVFERTAGVAIDPFAPADPERPSFLSFLLRLSNNSSDPLELHGQNSWLVTNKKQILYPLGLDALHSLFSGVGRNPSAAFLRLRPAMIEGRVFVEPDSSASGVLTYRVPSGNTRRFHVELQIVDAAGGVEKVLLPYKRKAHRARKTR